MDSQDDIVIVVMGSTGTGKSSFVKLLTSNSTVKIGTTLDSETSSVQIVRFVDPASRRNVVIVDTPGFDDSRQGFTDTQILTTITNFLLDEYDNNRQLNALVYLQRISDPRFGGQTSRNLRMFRSLCGSKNYKNSIVLTTFWDRVDVEEEGLKREEQLRSRYLKDLLDGGARFMRYNQTVQSAQRVLSHVLTLTPTNVEIQKEIRVEGKSLEETAAGSVHREEVDRMIAQHNTEVAELRSELATIKEADQSLRRELEEERANLQEKIIRWENEKLALKKGLQEARESRKGLEADAATATANRQKSRQELESNWSMKSDAQRKAHSAAVQNMQNQLDQRKAVRQEAEQQAQIQQWRELESPPPYEEVFNGLARPRNTNFQFTQSDIYPSYLRSIPPLYQVQTQEIFRFTSLIQTTVIVFIGPTLLPNNMRRRAPDSNRTHSMQDLVTRNRELHLESHNRGDVDMYYARNVGLRDDWYTDAVFGQQQFIGTNPTTITLASSRWIKEFKAASHAQRRADVEKLLTDDSKNLFVQDYSDYRSIMGVSSEDEFFLEGRHGCSSVALFHLEPKGKLHPLAITIDYRGSMERSVTIFNRRTTSASRGDEATDWPWRYAKMCSQVSDWFRHEVSVHLVYTHLVEEVLIVAAHRTFDPSHIVFNLLEPHWKTTLPLNKAAREILVPKIIIPLTGFTDSQTYTFIKSQFGTFDWTGSYVPNDLPRRGFPIEDLDKVKLHNYGYARNIYRMWQIIRKFVSNVLNQVYVGGDAQVASDTSLAAFCREVRSDSGGQLSSFPDIKTLDELIDFVTMGIHIASPQHTAVNYLQQYYQTFIPNKPSALFQPLPHSLEELQAYTEKDILSALPIHRPKDWLIMAQVPYLLSFEVDENSTILHYAKTTSNEVSTPGPIRNAASSLQNELEAFVYTVSKHSTELDDQQTPYLVLDPVRTAISILI